MDVYGSIDVDRASRVGFFHSLRIGRCRVCDDILEGIRDLRSVALSLRAGA